MHSKYTVLNNKYIVNGPHYGIPGSLAPRGYYTYCSATPYLYTDLIPTFNLPSNLQGPPSPNPQRGRAVQNRGDCSAGHSTPGTARKGVERPERLAGGLPGWDLPERTTTAGIRPHAHGHLAYTAIPNTNHPGRRTRWL